MIPRLFRFYAPALHDRPLSRCPRAGSHCVSNRQTLLFLDKKLSSETLQPARGSDRKRPGNHCHRPIKTNRPCQRATLTRPNRPSDSAKEPERPVQRASFSRPFGPFDNLIKPSRDVKKSQSVECQRVGDFAEMRVCAAAEASPENIASTGRENGQIV